MENNGKLNTKQNKNRGKNELEEKKYHMRQKKYYFQAEKQNNIDLMISN
jgi:hypothetical protein